MFITTQEKKGTNRRPLFLPVHQPVIRENYSAALAVVGTLRAGNFSLMRADLPERSRK